MRLASSLLPTLIFLLCACNKTDVALLQSTAHPPVAIEYVPFDISPFDGSYTAGEHKGSFSVGSYRHDFAQAVTGVDRYTLQGPMIEGQLAADCAMGDNSISIDHPGFTPKPHAYRCSFTVDGRAFPARFELQEAGANTQKRGEAALDRVILQIRSVDMNTDKGHDAAVAGYVFMQSGLPVGAVMFGKGPKGKPDDRRNEKPYEKRNEKTEEKPNVLSADKAYRMSDLYLPANADVPLRRAIVASAAALYLLESDPGSVSH